MRGSPAKEAINSDRAIAETLAVARLPCQERSASKWAAQSNYRLKPEGRGSADWCPRADHAVLWHRSTCRFRRSALPTIAGYAAVMRKPSAVMSTEKSKPVADTHNEVVHTAESVLPPKKPPAPSAKHRSAAGGFGSTLAVMLCVRPHALHLNHGLS